MQAQRRAATMENSVVVPQTLTLNYYLSQQFHFWVYTQKNCNQELSKYLHPPVHSSIIQTAKTPVCGFTVDKPNVVYT